MQCNVIEREAEAMNKLHLKALLTSMAAALAIKFLAQKILENDC